MWPAGELTHSTIFGFLDKNQKSHGHLFEPELIWNEADGKSMLNAIRHELQRSESFIFSIAFITSNALAMLKQDWIDAAARGVQ